MYSPNPDRYKLMKYRRLGNSGLKLPVLSFGMWYNFGANNDYDTAKTMILKAFDHGITHFDLANNYGPPPGHAETVMGRILKESLMPYRDEIIISTKAGYRMWDGPYQDGGSKKYLVSSLNQSLSRLGIPYVDIFYHHRFDHETNLLETMRALAHIVNSGKALYVGLSNYNSEQLKQAHAILDRLNVPYVITQPSYSMLNRWIEKDNLLETQYSLGGGVICYSALQQGLLTNKYIGDIPSDSRAKNPDALWFKERDITPEIVEKLIKLDVVAKKRGQSIAQMALVWTLRNEKMTSTLISTSKVKQLEENLEALNNMHFTDDETNTIDDILNS